MIFSRNFLSICVFFFSVSLSYSNDPDRKTITLQQAIEIALESNTALEAARQRLKASGYKVKKSRLDLLPKADLQFTYSRLDPATVRRGNVFVDVGRSLVENFGAGDPNDIRPGAYGNNFTTTFQVVQPIYNGGANWAAVSLARSQEESSEQNYEDTRQNLILQVKNRYLVVLQARELVNLARKSLESSQEHLRNAKKMLEVGLRSRTDVLRWEVQTANSEGDLVEAENGLKLAMASLNQAMGVPVQQQTSVQPLPFDPVPLDLKLEEQIDRAITHHPGLKAVDAAVDAHHAGVRLALAAFQPRINFVYQLGWERNNTLALDSFSFWNAGISVDFPIFQSFSNVARLQESKANLRQIEANKQEAEGLITLDVIRARLRVETAHKKFFIARKAVEQAEENLAVLDNSYKVGLAANIDVLDAQVIHTQAETDLIKTRYDYWIARAELDRAMGLLKE